MIQLARQERFEVLDLAKSKKGYAKLGQIFEIYRSAAVARNLRGQTIENYIRSLKLIVGRGKGQGNVGAMSACVLSRELVEKYTSATLKAAGKDPMKQDRARRTARSTLRQARSIFSRWAMDAYRDLKIPDLSDFMKTEGIRNEPVTYRLPPDSLREETITQGRLREKDADLYAAFLLCYDLGLRAGEASNVQWLWIRRAHSNGTERRFLDVVKRADFKPKGKERSIPISDMVLKHLQEIRRPGDPFVLAGENPSAREDLVKRRFAKWMRNLGWEAETYPKAAHELRKMIGSRWYTELGAEVAQSWLGHKDISTTCRFYAALDRQPDALPMEGV